MLCAPVFMAQMFRKSRFKIDVVMMIICSIVNIINSVLTRVFTKVAFGIFCKLLFFLSVRDFF
jgi:hypothetical protein